MSLRPGALGSALGGKSCKCGVVKFLFLRYTLPLLRGTESSRVKIVLYLVTGVLMPDGPACEGRVRAGAAVGHTALGRDCCFPRTSVYLPLSYALPAPFLCHSASSPSSSSGAAVLRSHPAGDCRGGCASYEAEGKAVGVCCTHGVQSGTLSGARCWEVRATPTAHVTSSGSTRGGALCSQLSEVFLAQAAEPDGTPSTAQGCCAV